MNRVIKELLRKFGYRIERISHNPTPTQNQMFRTDEIGMKTSLRGLLHRGFAPRQILDIGAAHGGWTTLCRQYFPEAHYYLVEPMSERRAALEELKSRHNNLDYTIAAAGADNAEREIGISSDQYGTSFIHRGIEQRTVQVVTMDSLLGKGVFSPPDFMKLDIQGHEWYALTGASDCLKSTRIVLCECVFHPYTPTMKIIGDVVDLLRSCGFVPYEIVDTLRRAHSGAMGQCDMLFIRPGDPLIDDRHFVYPETGTFFRK